MSNDERYILSLESRIEDLEMVLHSMTCCGTWPKGHYCSDCGEFIDVEERRSP